MLAAALFPATGVTQPWRPAIRAPRARRVSACSSSGSNGGGTGTSTPGHLFVVHGDLRRILANDVLYPTRSFSHPVWFPDGPPDGAWPIELSRFTRASRVHRVEGLAEGQPRIWLGYVSWEGLSTAPVDWFLDAAEQVCVR